MSVELPIAEIDIEDPEVFGPDLEEAPKSPSREAFDALRHNKAFLFGLLLFVGFLLMATFAPWLAPNDPSAIAVGPRLSGPTLEFPMGTDEFGRDIFSRAIYGSRLSLLAAFASVAISATAGTAIGLVAGYRRGALDTALMRGVDVLLAFPGIMLALAVAALLGTGMTSVIVAVGIAGIPLFSRVIRGAVLSVSELDYVLAARAVGCPTSRIMRSHILPNVVGTAIVLATLQMAYAVLVASSLSFLGVGVQPPTPEWGAMANAGRSILVSGWWVSTFPGLMIVFFVISVNVMGDALRDALDRTLRHT